MSRQLSLLCAVLVSVFIYAHPSWGIVSSSDGHIYFVDVMHNGGTLWKFNPATHGFKILITGDFHAHTLQIDQEDKLYIGVQIWKQDEIMGDGHNYFFCYDTRNDRIDTLLFTDDYDVFNGGNSVFYTKDSTLLYSKDHRLYQAHLNGSSSLLWEDHFFERLSTMALGPDQSLWITDSYDNSGSLLRCVDGEFQVYRTNLIPEHPTHPVFEERSHQLLYGIGFTPEGAPIITQSATRRVDILHPNDSTETIYQSPIHYFPVGVCQIDNIFYIMEVGYIPNKGNIGPRIVEIKNEVQTTFIIPE